MIDPWIIRKEATEMVCEELKQKGITHEVMGIGEIMANIKGKMTSIIVRGTRGVVPNIQSKDGTPIFSFRGERFVRDDDIVAFACTSNDENRCIGYVWGKDQPKSVARFRSRSLSHQYEMTRKEAMNGQVKELFKHYKEQYGMFASNSQIYQDIARELGISESVVCGLHRNRPPKFILFLQDLTLDKLLKGK